MPKKPTTTREDMIEGAFRLVREKGHEFLTARNLAAFLGCSTQPIMYQFPNMETLREFTYQRADAFHTEYLLADGDLLEIGLRYIRFAKEEPQLFCFLFQSGHFSGISLKEIICSPEVEGVLKIVSAQTDFESEDMVAFFEPMVAMVHGYASLIANNAMKYDSNAIKKALIVIAEGFMRRIRDDEIVSKE